MTLNQLKIIAALINNRLNVSLAANELYRVQSALSNQLRLLEEEFGGKLFERHGKRLTKTTLLCKALLPEIKCVLIAEKNIKSLAREHANPDKGELRIATTHTQARYFLPKTIAEFLARYPEVRLGIHQGSPADFMNMLQRHRIDLAIFSNEDNIPAEFIKTKCYSWNRVLILPEGHALENERITLKKIARYPIITYPPDFSDRSIMENTFARAGINMDVAFSAGDTEVIKTYVRLNLGIAIVAQMAKPRTMEKNGKSSLVYRNLSHLFRNSTTCAVHLKGLVMREYMRKFTQMLYLNGERFEKVME